MYNAEAVKREGRDAKSTTFMRKRYFINAWFVQIQIQLSSCSVLNYIIISWWLYVVLNFRGSRWEYQIFWDKNLQKMQ